MNDRELIRKLMYVYDWNQGELAEQLGITQPQISRILNERQNFRPATRKLAEKLLKGVAEEETV